jgi:hypothetical protein
VTPDLTAATNGIASAANALLDARLTATDLGYAIEYGDKGKAIDLLICLNDSMEAVRVALGAATGCFELYRHADSDAVERLREIDNVDALAEGTQDLRTKENNWDRRDCFRELWNSINAKRGFGWDKNPWVWVVEFRRVTP